MSLGDLLPVGVYELAFLASFCLLPVLVLKAEVESYMFGMVVLYVCLRVIRRRKSISLPSAGKAVFISGCDTGFGHMVAQRLDSTGYSVFAGCLFPDGEGAQSLVTSCSDNLHIIPLDVSDDVSVRNAGEKVRELLGTKQLWGVVNNAGIYGHGDVELCSLDTYKRLADVNLFGMIRVTQEFLPLIRQSRGRIVSMSSINGRFPWPSTSAYNATKYGIECVSDCLRLEMIKFGVRVSLIEPAMFGGSTNIHGADNIARHFKAIDEQRSASRPEVKETYTREYMRAQIEQIVSFRQRLDAKSPEAVISAIEHAVCNSRPNQRYVVHGGPFQVDPIAIFGVIYPFLPTCISDCIISRMTGHHSMDMLRACASNNPPTATNKNE